MQEQRQADFPLNGPSKALEPLLGTWETVGTHGMIPDTVLHGRASFERLQPGGLVRWRSSIREDVGIPAGVAIIGSDDELGVYSMVYYDERGVSRIYEVGVEDDGMRWWRSAPSFAQRYSLTFAEDPRTMTGRGELCRDGSTWERDLDLTYTRVEP
ncbi:MAG: hypothetical protein QOE37_1587 [Microbacteriaceae bacterium]|nr:hypothetical protein [Microbacteriaceae bacterium]